MSPWRCTRGRAGRFEPNPAGQTPPNRPRLPITTLLLGLLLWVFVLVLVNLSSDRPYSGLAAGQRAPFTVVAQVDFVCEDVARTELNRQQAAAAVPPVFTINLVPLNTSIRTLDKLFGRLAQERRLRAEAPEAESLERTIGDVLDLLNISLSPSDAISLAPTGKEEVVLEVIRKSLREVWAVGIISPEEKESAFQGLASAGTVAVHAGEDLPRSPAPINDLLLPPRALELVVQRIRERLADVTLPRDPLTALLRPWLAPNLVYDSTTTAERRKAARLNVEPVMIKVPAGTTLVEAGAPIGPQILEQLQAHERRRRQLESSRDILMRRIGNAGLLMVALILCAGLLHTLDPSLLRQDSRLLLLMVLSLLSLGPTRLLMDLSSRANLIPPVLVEYALPLALAPLLGAILMNSSIAVTIGVWNSLAAAVLFDNSFAVLAQGLMVSVVAALMARDVRRRSQIYRAGAVVGLAQILFVISLGVINRIPATALLMQAGVGLANGFLCALLAILLIPLLEMAFRVTTNLTLLELSDMSHPLLQRLAMEAPGTYQHSIVVANLAQAAAHAVGANALLARVAAYFHDIGKLAKPEFFTENMRGGENPHDHLAPQTSTLVITSHVKEGLVVARRYKLPRCVLEGIEQHHGNGLVSFFYHRARQQQGQEAFNGRFAMPPPADADFRYEGPRPASREMAILSLADAVEAAARSLENPTPARVEGLVHEIAAAKLRDGQFDNAPLTLAELAEIQRVFVFSLANMLHVRIAYPQDENKSAQPAGPGAVEPRGPAETDAVAGGAGPR